MFAQSTGPAAAFYRNLVAAKVIGVASTALVAVDVVTDIGLVVWDVGEAITEADPMGGLSAGLGGIAIAGRLFPAMPKSAKSRYVKPWEDLLADLKQCKKNAKAMKPGGCCSVM